jgi:hypothetical protein
MPIILANPRRFCAGVERAIAIVERALEKIQRADSQGVGGKKRRGFCRRQQIQLQLQPPARTRRTAWYQSLLSRPS